MLSRLSANVLNYRVNKDGSELYVSASAFEKMALEKGEELVPSSNLGVNHVGPANVFYESQIIPSSPSININSVGSEVITRDDINFANEVFIMSQQPSGEPILYEATKEFKIYLQSRETEKVDPRKTTHPIVSGNNDQGKKKSLSCICNPHNSCAKNFADL